MTDSINRLPVDQAHVPTGADFAALSRWIRERGWPQWDGLLILGAYIGATIGRNVTDGNMTGEAGLLALKDVTDLAKTVLKNTVAGGG